MKLINLPRDVLEVILNGPNSFLAIELWKTGDRILQQTLANGGVTEMSLREGRRGWVQTKWPKCIKHFKLRSLRVVAPMMLMDTAAGKLRFQLLGLYSGITSLDLRWPSVYNDFFPMSIPNLVTGNSHLSPFASTGAQQAAHSTMRSLDARFDRLESLTLHGKEMPEWVARNILGALPRDLTSLHLIANRYRLTIQDLPPNLRSLTLPPEIDLSLEQIAHFPASLTELGSFMDQGTLMELAQTAHRLPNLKSFPRTYSGKDVALTPEDKHWPPNIHTLTLMDHTTCAEALPSQLTHLNCNLSPERALLYLYNLPPTLTRLDIEELPWEDMSAIFRQTPFLRVLALRRTPSSISLLSALPRTLEELDLHCTERELVEDQEARDAFDVTHLSVGIASLNSERELWQSLKSTLLSTRTRGAHAILVDQYISEIEKGRLFGLPLGLKTLTTSFKGDHFTCRRLAPPQLTSLNLLTSNGVRQPVFWNLLPASLTDLRVCATEPHIPWWSYLTTRQMSNSVIHKMKQLTSFSWVFATTELAEAVLPYLPSNLQNLTLTILQDKRLNVKVLSKLPRKLRALSLHTLIRSKNSWLGSLPRSLTSLKVSGGMALHGSDLQNMPPKLDYLSASFGGNVSRDDLLSLPRTLRKIDTPSFYEPHMRLVSIVYPFWRIWELSEEEIDALLTFDEGRPRRFGF